MNESPFYRIEFPRNYGNSSIDTSSSRPLIAPGKLFLFSEVEYTHSTHTRVYSVECLGDAAITKGLHHSRGRCMFAVFPGTYDSVFRRQPPCELMA